MRFRTKIAVGSGLLAVLAILIALLFAPILEHSRRQSPDGRFLAVTRTQPYRLFVTVMPGGGSDKPALVTVYRDGRSCGSAWVEMAWFADDLRWRLEGNRREAEVRLQAIWNLDDCTVRAD